MLRALPNERAQRVLWQTHALGHSGPTLAAQEGVTRERIRQILGHAEQHVRHSREAQQALRTAFAPLEGHVVAAAQLASEQDAPHWTFLLAIAGKLQSERRYAHTIPPSGALTQNQRFVFVASRPLNLQPLRRRLAQGASYLAVEEAAQTLGLSPEAFITYASTDPHLRVTRSGWVGSTEWGAPQVIHAVAERLSEAGFKTWHFSELARAGAVHLPSLETLSAKECAKLFTSGRAAKEQLFTRSGQEGRWQLKRDGDGHRTNLEAILTVLADAQKPMSVSEITQALQRDVNPHTVRAALQSTSRVDVVGRGHYVLRRETPDSENGTTPQRP